MKHRFLPVLRILPAAALVFALQSCGPDDHDPSLDDSTNMSDSADQATGDTAQKELPVGVPSPSEMFAFMKAAGSDKADFNLLNPVDNSKKYESKKAQSLNLGIYSADLLYCATFGAGSDKVVPYFGVCAQMGDKLKVATNLTDKDKDRISANAGNGDSLVAISSDLYLTSFENLENGERGADLSLMLAGGWVESLYLMSTMVKDFEKDKATADRIADQKLSLDNLIEFMSKYESNADVKDVTGKLKELKTLFDATSTASTSSSDVKVKNGRRVLGGGPKTTITKEQFEKIKAKITEIRTGFINGQ
jgi:hypothetical protein